MNASDSTSSNTLGYLTYVRIPNLGIVGGCLLVNERARPIEFHCTAPVQSTRSQQILYGRTFRSALLCDNIGSALLQQTTHRVDLLLTDVAEALALRQTQGVPIALFVPDEENTLPQLFDAAEVCSETNDSESNAEGDSLRREWSFEFGGYSFTSPPDFPDDRESIRSTLLQVARDWDLAEPLERIRAAIQEAQRAAA